MSDYEIQKELVISTAHVHPDTMENLEMGGYFREFLIVYDHGEYGVRIYTSPSNDEVFERECAKKLLPHHHELVALLNVARANECTFLRLDRDGPEHDEHPNYSWEWEQYEKDFDFS